MSVKKEVGDHSLRKKRTLPLKADPHGAVRVQALAGSLCSVLGQDQDQEQDTLLSQSLSKVTSITRNRRIVRET